jgi:hypothetical protein
MNDHDQIVDELDLEDFAKRNEGLAAPAARRYKIRIDKDHRHGGQANPDGPRDSRTR